MSNKKENQLFISDDANERADLIKNTPSGDYLGNTAKQLVCVVTIKQGYYMIVRTNSAKGYSEIHYRNDGEATSYDKRTY